MTLDPHEAAVLRAAIERVRELEDTSRTYGYWKDECRKHDETKQRLTAAEKVVEAAKNARGRIQGKHGGHYQGACIDAWIDLLIPALEEYDR